MDAMFETNKDIYKRLEGLLFAACRQGRREDALNLAILLARFAVTFYSGALRSQRAEECLNAISAGIEPVQSGPEIAGTKRKVLHLFSQTYHAGGHTKLAYSWIKNDSDTIHWVGLADQRTGEIPRWLADAAHESGGEVFDLDGRQGKLEQAAFLKGVVDRFDVVVLHLHMYDPLANLIFGDGRRKAAAIYLNHSDHLFWLGSDAVNMIAEIRPSGRDISKLKRRSTNSFVLDIPLAKPRKFPLTKAQARTELGIPQDETLYLSIAAAYKYEPSESCDFFAMLEQLHRTLPKARVVVVGPSRGDGRWQRLYEQSGGRIEAVGIVTQGLELYHLACDIYLDSFPMNSLTSFLEPALRKKAVICFDSELLSSVASVQNTPSLAKTQRQYLNKAIDAASNPDKYLIYDRVVSNHCMPAWGEKLQRLYGVKEQPYRDDDTSSVDPELEKEFERYFIKRLPRLKKSYSMLLRGEFKQLSLQYRFKILFSFAPLIIASALKKSLGREKGEKV